mmetsp:Transcript_36050/g.117319  ORF Transcript_36050/g.117319 Transcript_36050/m.117319 type:complete len:241 (-) Transcript_36050:246-968(-)
MPMASAQSSSWAMWIAPAAPPPPSTSRTATSSLSTRATARRGIGRRKWMLGTGMPWPAGRRRTGSASRRTTRWCGCLRWLATWRRSTRHSLGTTESWHGSGSVTRRRPPATLLRPAAAWAPASPGRCSASTQTAARACRAGALPPAVGRSRPPLREDAAARPSLAQRRWSCRSPSGRSRCGRRRSRGQSPSAPRPAATLPPCRWRARRCARTSPRWTGTRASLSRGVCRACGWRTRRGSG